MSLPDATNNRTLGIELGMALGTVLSRAPHGPIATPYLLAALWQVAHTHPGTPLAALANTAHSAAHDTLTDGH